MVGSAFDRERYFIVLIGDRYFNRFLKGIKRVPKRRPRSGSPAETISRLRTLISPTSAFTPLAVGRYLPPARSSRQARSGLLRLPHATACRIWFDTADVQVERGWTDGC